MNKMTRRFVKLKDQSISIKYQLNKDKFLLKFLGKKIICYKINLIYVSIE